jgi:hypothetical protein
MGFLDATSEMGQKHRFDRRLVTSDLTQQADIFGVRRDVSNVRIAAIGPVASHSINSSPRFLLPSSVLTAE